MVMSMPPQIKQELYHGPAVAINQQHSKTTRMNDVVKKTPVKKSTFFSIDQILGKTENESSDDDVFERDDSSFDGDSNDIDMTDDVDENNNETDDKNNDDVDDSKSDKDKTDKQTPSYTAIIAQAILSSSDKKLPLGCIYEYIAEHFPEFLKKGQGWRNCVRHNLSLSECFIKAGRARNGRGNYWGIHPRYLKNFSKGDFRKRRASHRPRNRDMSFGYNVGRYYPHYYNPYLSTTSYNKTLLTSQHRILPTEKPGVPGFSVDNILSSERSTTPPILSSYKTYTRDEKAPLSPLRSNYRMYSPPVLSSTISPTSHSYLDQYGYKTPYEYGRPGRTTTECSCHGHHSKCIAPRKGNI